MKHICETMRDYIDAMNTSMQGDTIFCSEELWNHIMKSQLERSKREDVLCKNGHYHKGLVSKDENQWNCDICGVLIKRCGALNTIEI